jgi:1-acyl-sn-glycerol-3-phosphate acyltransferase
MTLFGWLRSIIFIAQMYIMMVIVGLSFMPLAFFNRLWAYTALHFYCRYVRWSAHWIVGLKSEVRGDIPTDEVLVASKHQSFFDIIILTSVLPRPKFIMKKSLRHAPLLGFYARCIACVHVDRGKRGKAISDMLRDVKAGDVLPGQLVIYPQGTRVAPGVKRDYKAGIGALYEQTGQPCVPAATNVGVFWPRHGFYRKPGLAVIEFLPRIDPGMPIDDFRVTLQEQIETTSDRLMEDAGFKVPAE